MYDLPVAIIRALLMVVKDESEGETEGQDLVNQLRSAMLLLLLLLLQLF